MFRNFIRALARKSSSISSNIPLHRFIEKESTMLAFPAVTHKSINSYDDVGMMPLGPFSSISYLFNFMGIALKHISLNNIVAFSGLGDDGFECQDTSGSSKRKQNRENIGKKLSK